MALDIFLRNSTYIHPGRSRKSRFRPGRNAQQYKPKKYLRSGEKKNTTNFYYIHRSIEKQKNFPLTSGDYLLKGRLIEYNPSMIILNV